MGFDTAVEVFPGKEESEATGDPMLVIPHAPAHREALVLRRAFEGSGSSSRLPGDRARWHFVSARRLLLLGLLAGCSGGEENTSPVQDSRVDGGHPATNGDREQADGGPVDGGVGEEGSLLDVSLGLDVQADGEGERGDADGDRAAPSQGDETDDGAADAEPTGQWDAATRPPNILLIVADDLGYSDIHAFGGEIDTPNLDELAANGRILTNHHVGAMSAVTRSMLISGADHHLVGFGTQAFDNDERLSLPGYEQHLNDRALSIAELLKDAGYHTYIAGKWHLGYGVVGRTTGLGKTPDQWGFERSYALLGGAACNQFAHETADSTNYSEDGVYVQPGQPGQPGGEGGAPGGAPSVFYSTDFYTQQLIEYIDSSRGDGRPFFAYAAYTSAHSPLQVPEPWLSMYRGKYDDGYAPIRAARLARLQALGVMPPGATAYPGMRETLDQSPASANWSEPSLAEPISAVHGPVDGYVDYRAGIVNKQWESLSALEKKAQARYMEIFAGMVSNLDHNIGLLIEHLKDIGEYDRTFILFHSDNGPEGAAMGLGVDPKPWDEAYAANGVYEALGTDNGQPCALMVLRGLRWAEVGATPFSQMKSWLGEGGTSVPTIVHMPGQTQSLPALDAFTHVTDEPATFLDLAGVAPPGGAAPVSFDAGASPTQAMVVYKGRSVFPITGQSLLPMLRGETQGPFRRATQVGDELFGRACVYGPDGTWKARWTEPPFGPSDGHWELFDLNSDRGETQDLSAQHPGVVESLYRQWQGYMTRVGGVEPIRPHGYY